MDTTTVTKLNDMNYYLWKNQIVLALKAKGYMKFIQHESLEDYQKQITRSYAIKPDPDKKADPEKLIKEAKNWMENDQKCHATICLTLDQKYIEHFSTPNSYVLWKKLEELHMTDQSSLKADLICQLFTLKMKSEDTLMSFLDTIIIHLNKIKDYGDNKMNIALESIICYYVLGSLPDKYSVIKQHCRLLDEKNLNIEYLKIQFQKDIYKDKKTKSENLNTTSFQRNSYNSNTNNNTSNYNNTSNNNNNNNQTCSKCGMNNHTTNNCQAAEWKILKFKESQKKKTNNNNHSNNNHSNNNHSNNNQSNNNRSNNNNSRQNNNNNSNNKTANTNEVEVSIAFNASITINDDDNNIDSKLYLDSGATKHMVNNTRNINNFNNTKYSIKTALRNQDEPLVNAGELIFRSQPDSNNIFNIKLNEVLLVPNLRKNLVSVTEICKNESAQVIFQNDTALVMKDGKVLIKAVRDDIGLYAIKEEDYNIVNNSSTTSSTLSVSTTTPSTSSVTTNSPTNNNSLSISLNSTTTDYKQQLLLWHQRLGHASISKMKLMKDKNEEINNIFNNIEVTKLECEICCKSKQTRKPFNKSRKKKPESSKIGELIHSDIVGPLKEDSFGGYKYIVTFIDDSTRYSKIYLLKKRDELLEKFKEYRSLVRTQANKKILKIRNDKGGEYISSKFRKFLKRKGITEDPHPVNTPQHSGVAERFNRSLLEKTRALLKQHNLDLKFWSHAVITANFLLQRTPIAIINNSTPNQLFTKKEPNYNSIKVFGSKCSVKKNDEGGNGRSKGKLDDRSEICIIVGFDEVHNSYLVYNPRKNKVTQARDVIFFEDKTLESTQNNSTSNKNSSTNNNKKK
jgi:hypothetical protein